MCLCVCLDVCAGVWGSEDIFRCSSGTNYLFCFNFFLLLACVLRQGLLHSSGCPRTHYLHQTGLELAEIHLPLPPKCVLGLKAVPSLLTTIKPVFCLFVCLFVCLF